MPFRSRDQHAVTPQSRGRFPGFDVLDQAHVWDDVTAGVVLARLALPGTLAFFTPAEVAVARPLLDLLLAQDGEPRIPVLELIDARLADRRNRRLALRRSSRGRHRLAGHAGTPRRGRPPPIRGTLSPKSRQGSRPNLFRPCSSCPSGGDPWHGLPAPRVWSLWTRYACTAFYSHPWAWNEIGFRGPAYPRGYLNPGIDAREKWEVADHNDLDPVPFAARVERARKDHADLTGGTSS